MNIAEFKAIQNMPTQSKYHNKITEIDGHKFASKLEADYYSQLKLLKRAGEIRDYELQPRFTLQPAYVTIQGKKVTKVEYVADFLVTLLDGKQEVVDCKGARTAVYSLKKKWFEYNYRHLTIKEVT